MGDESLCPDIRVSNAPLDSVEILLLTVVAMIPVGVYLYAGFEVAVVLALGMILAELMRP